MSAPLNKDEARKLLGGYATGSLSEAERTALFQAALEDQELFDELAGEQSLKEVLDEPGARQRLIAALEPPRRHRFWVWATAGATVAIAVVVGVVVSQRTSPPVASQQVAQVLKSPELAEPVRPVAPSVAEPVPVRQKVASPPAALPAPPPPEVKLKEETATLAERADQVQEVKPQAAAGALRQFAAAVAPSLFAFNYSVGSDGFLVITPASRGFLSVAANDMIIYPSAAVTAGNPIRIAIPSGTTSLVIGFSVMPGNTGAPAPQAGSAGTVTDQDPPNGKILIELSLTPATR